FPGSGLGTTVHDVPSQCSMRALSGLSVFTSLSKPTAQASHADSTATPWSRLPTVPGLTGCTPAPGRQAAAAAAPAGASPVSNPASTSGAASAVATRPAGHRARIGSSPSDDSHNQ